MTDGFVRRVIVGSGDVDSTVTFLGLFGFVVSGSRRGASGDAHELWGRSGPFDSVELCSPLATGGPFIDVLPTDGSNGARAGWESGPAALDIYVRDLDVAVAQLSDAGHRVSPVGEISLGPMTMRQAMVSGPEALAVVLVESTHRRSSVLDTHGDALFSEPHSVVWVVDDHPSEVATWVAAGWTAGPTISFSEPTISDELGLADRPAAITMTTVSDPTVGAARLELMSFDDHRSSPAIDAAPAASGRPPMRGVAAVVVSRFDGCTARGLLTPGGVRVVVDIS